MLRIVKVPRTISATITQNPRSVGIMPSSLPPAIAAGLCPLPRLGELVPGPHVRGPALVAEHDHFRSLADRLPVGAPGRHRLAGAALRVHDLAAAARRDRH